MANVGCWTSLSVQFPKSLASFTTIFLTRGKGHRHPAFLAKNGLHWGRSGGGKQLQSSVGVSGALEHEAMLTDVCDSTSGCVCVAAARQKGAAAQGSKQSTTVPGLLSDEEYNRTITITIVRPERLVSGPRKRLSDFFWGPFTSNTCVFGSRPGSQYEGAPFEKPRVPQSLLIVAAALK